MIGKSFSSFKSTPSQTNPNSEDKVSAESPFTRESGTISPLHSSPPIDSRQYPSFVYSNNIERDDNTSPANNFYYFSTYNNKNDVPFCLQTFQCAVAAAVRRVFLRV